MSDARTRLRDELLSAARKAAVAREGAGPPRPIPDYLWPQRSPLSDGDLRVVPSTEELRCIARLLDHEGLAGQAMLTQRDGSPWLEVDVAVPVVVMVPDFEELEQVAAPGTYRYAIWRYTCLPYRLGPDGAVEDDPIWGRPGDG